MKKVAIIIASLVVIGSGSAAAVWFMNSRSTTAPSTSPDQSGPSVSAPSTELPASGEVNIHIRNSSFVPGRIVIKKGTKVTWINDDSMQHNVVASNVDNSGGLPTQNSLLGKDGSYSFTFNTAGTFDYHCAPHPFMTGTVVVE